MPLDEKGSFAAIVTLDGPAGVGKTTLARNVAEALGIFYMDTGAMFMNNEPPETIEQVRDWIGHVHISEPQLAPLGESGVSHAQIGESFKKAMGQTSSIVTIEMLIPKGDGADRAALIERAIVQAVELVRSNYL